LGTRDEREFGSRNPEGIFWDERSIRLTGRTLAASGSQVYNGVIGSRA
jgi:hypothetical protein